MNNYVRTMIYLREADAPEQTIGYLRLERKGGYLLFSLVLTEKVLEEGSSIYIVCQQDGRQRQYCVGRTGGGSRCEGKILQSKLPQWSGENPVCGAVIGTKENYCTGVVDSTYSLPVWQGDPTMEEVVCALTEKAPVQAAEGTGNHPHFEAERETASGEEENRYFEDDEMVWCRSVQPMEVSNLDMEQWYLAANSFLLQGYYNYHHLIYASDGEKVYLGVPGQYHRREWYMAKRFGFPVFKGRRKKPVRAGDFGYWLREIKKEE